MSARLALRRARNRDKADCTADCTMVRRVHVKGALHAVAAMYRDVETLSKMFLGVVEQATAAYDQPPANAKRH